MTRDVALVTALVVALLATAAPAPACIDPDNPWAHRRPRALRHGTPDQAGAWLPDDQRIPMRRDTIFDLASISKLFTAVAILQLVEDGVLDPDAPAATVIPDFGQAGKDQITVRHCRRPRGVRPDAAVR
jgi:hypothetical protein